MTFESKAENDERIKCRLVCEQELINGDKNIIEGQWIEATPAVVTSTLADRNQNKSLPSVKTEVWYVIGENGEHLTQFDQD